MQGVGTKLGTVLAYPPPPNGTTHPPAYIYLKRDACDPLNIRAHLVPGRPYFITLLKAGLALYCGWYNTEVQNGS